MEAPPVQVVAKMEVPQVHVQAVMAEVDGSDRTLLPQLVSATNNFPNTMPRPASPRSELVGKTLAQTNISCTLFRCMANVGR